MRKGNCLKGPLSQVIDSVSYIHTAGTKLKCRWNSNTVQLERLAPVSYQCLLACYLKTAILKDTKLVILITLDTFTGVKRDVKIVLSP